MSFTIFVILFITGINMIIKKIECMGPRTATNKNLQSIGFKDDHKRITDTDTCDRAITAHQ